METRDEFQISIQDDGEDSMWWNQGKVDKSNRPGQGFLPHTLADIIHNAKFPLYSLQLELPKPPKVQSFNTVLESEIMRGLPYEGAYYCPDENGWRILLCTTSSVEPYFVQSFREEKSRHLPEMSRRRMTEPLCVDNSASRSMRPNKTHHFHKYEGVIDSHKLNPPYRRDCWRSSMSNANTTLLHTSNEDAVLFDLYICCQCPLSFVASGLISGAMHPGTFNEITQPDKNGHSANWNVADASRAAIVMQNVVKAVAISINTYGKGRFPKARCQHLERILEELGFEKVFFDIHDYGMKAPTTNTALPGGRETRHKFIRIWWELNAWIAHLCLINPKLKDLKTLVPYVRLTDVRQVHRKTMNICSLAPNDLTRIIAPGVDVSTLGIACKGLGIDPMSTSAELLIFAYLAQCRCDPINTVTYFTYLTDIVAYLQKHENCSVLLQRLVELEQARGRFTLNDVKKAATTLGFGQENVLRLDYDEQVPEEMIVQAWISCLKKSWTDSISGEQLRINADCSLKQLAEYRGSLDLWNIWKNREQEHVKSKLDNVTETKRVKLESTVKEEEKVILKIEQNHSLQESCEARTDGNIIVEGHPDKKSRSIIYKFDGKQVLAKQRSSYNETVSFCRVLFSDIKPANRIDLCTADPIICQGEETKVLEESWNDVAGEIKTIKVIICEEYDLATESAPQGDFCKRKPSSVSSHGTQSIKRSRLD